MEDTQQVGDKENQENRTQAYAGTSPRAPTAIAIVSATDSKNQQQDDKHE